MEPMTPVPEDAPGSLKGPEAPAPLCGTSQAACFPGPLSEEELTRAALEDPAGQLPLDADHGPTLWRPVFILVVAVAALWFVFR